MDKQSQDNFKAQDNIKTQHSKVYNYKYNQNTMVTLDNPDDRITEQTGNGLTLVETDNPDDAED